MQCRQCKCIRVFPDTCDSLLLQMIRNPGHCGLQLRTSDPAAVKAAIREKFVNTALKQLAEHGMVRQSYQALSTSWPLHQLQDCSL